MGINSQALKILDQAVVIPNKQDPVERGSRVKLTSLIQNSSLANRSILEHPHLTEWIRQEYLNREQGNRFSLDYLDHYAYYALLTKFTNKDDVLINSPYIRGISVLGASKWKVGTEDTALDTDETAEEPDDETDETDEIDDAQPISYQAGKIPWLDTSSPKWAGLELRAYKPVTRYTDRMYDTLNSLSNVQISNVLDDFGEPEYLTKVLVDKKLYSAVEPGTIMKRYTARATEYITYTILERLEYKDLSKLLKNYDIQSGLNILVNPKAYQKILSGPMECTMSRLIVRTALALYIRKGKPSDLTKAIKSYDLGEPFKLFNFSPKVYSVLSTIQPIAIDNLKNDVITMANKTLSREQAEIEYKSYVTKSFREQYEKDTTILLFLRSQSVTSKAYYDSASDLRYHIVADDDILWQDNTTGEAVTKLSPKKILADLKESDPKYQGLCSLQLARTDFVDKIYRDDIAINEFCSQIIEEYSLMRAGASKTWHIATTSDGTLCGGLTLYETDQPNELALSLWTNYTLQNLHAATEALFITINRLFKYNICNRVSLSIHPKNRLMIKIVKRLGGHADNIPAESTTTEFQRYTITDVDIAGKTLDNVTTENRAC